MISLSGTHYVYVVGSVNLIEGKADVSYYADGAPAYGLCRVDDINDPCVITFETEKEALRFKPNRRNFVLCKKADESSK